MMRRNGDGEFGAVKSGMATSMTATSNATTFKTATFTLTARRMAGGLSARALAILVAGGLLAGCVGGPEDYYDDGSAAVAQEGQPLMHRLLTGAGIVDPPPAQIEYAPRSPIVVPPTTDLRPPSASPSEIAGGEWPTDPEEIEAAARASGKMDPGEALRDAMHSGGRLSTAEVQAGRIPGGGLSGTEKPIKPESTQRLGQKMSPTELQTLKVNSPESSGPNIGEAPTRRYLIEPPAEYRTPAATAAMPEDPSKGKPITDGIGDPRLANRQMPGVAGN